MAGAPNSGWLLDADLVAARLAAATQAAEHLVGGGQQLHLEGHLFGDGRVKGTSLRGNGDDELVGLGVLATIAGELLGTSADLLCGDHHYSGAAHLRQVVEVEYLTWSFAHDKRDAAAWLNSTKAERRNLWSPNRLRQASDGLFNASDYAHHCEQGGHPVPRGMYLLGSHDVAAAQMLMLDLLLHCWRTTDNVIAWEARRGRNPMTPARGAARHCFASWASRDPLYSWSLTAPPAPPTPDGL